MALAKPEGPQGARWVSLQEVIDCLAHTIGHDKSVEVVAAAAAELGLKEAWLQRQEADALLDQLGKTPGMVGSAARSAQRRGLRAEEAMPPSSARPRLTEAPASTPPASAPRSAPVSAPKSAPGGVRGHLVTLLSSALGAEKAEEIIAAASRKLGFGAQLDGRQATAILDDLASAPGPIGAMARFAKARFLLRK
jgi:hypothetical protein